jgi:hypothetical protein
LIVDGSFVSKHVSSVKCKNIPQLAFEIRKLVIEQKNSLMISNRQLEAVFQRRTDNTMAKKKKRTNSDSRNKTKKTTTKTTENKD